MPKVSVVVPVYKAEKYIEKCAESLFGQSLAEMEFIFVDDCSPDRSIEIIEKVLDRYPKRKGQVKIIRHEINKKVSAARKTGVDAATGEYIIFCDSDDWVDTDMYLELYRAAVVDNSDVVYCDLFFVVNNVKQIVCQADTSGGVDVIQKLLQADINSSLCVKLVRSELYKNNKEYLNVRSMYDDTATSLFLLYTAKVIKHVKKPFYYYIMRPNSIGTSISQAKSDERAEDAVYNSEKIICFINGLPENEQKQLVPYLNGFLLKVKWHLLNWWRMDGKKLSSWQTLWPGTSEYIFAVPWASGWKKRIYWLFTRKQMSFLFLPVLSFYKKYLH